MSRKFSLTPALCYRFLGPSVISGSWLLGIPLMFMNWPKEFEVQLADDPRFERGKSRFSEATAIYYEGKELAHFQGEGIDIRLTAAGIYALQARLVTENVITVAKDWVLLRLASEEDNKFAMAVLERAVREAHNASPGPKGKQTRKTSRKSEATRAFGIAKALKDLEEFDPSAPTMKKSGENLKPAKSKARKMKK